ncbi:hypothetical protein MASR2M48_18920 [Spirochaetota bacterium]
MDISSLKSSSLLDMQSQSTAPEVRALFEVAINRVDSMVVLYDKLLSSEEYDSISCKSFLDDILEILLSFFLEWIPYGLRFGWKTSALLPKSFSL